MKQRVITTLDRVFGADFPLVAAVATAICGVYAFTKPGLSAPGTLRIIGGAILVASLFDLLRTPWRGIGISLARGGVVAMLLLGELEIGQGPHYFKVGDDWLLIGLGFAVQVLWLEQRERDRRRARDADEAVRRQQRADELDAWRMTISAKLEGPTAPPSPPSSFVFLSGAAIGGAVVLLLAGARRAQQRGDAVAALKPMTTCLDARQSAAGRNGRRPGSRSPRQ